MKPTTTIALVVAMAENGVIGRDGGLPWHLPEDLRYFRAVTMGKPIVMGRRTYEAIGRPLPGRVNIVVTRNRAFHPAGVEVAATLEEAIRIAESSAAEAEVDEVMVIGGAQIYQASLCRARRIYLTEVHQVVEGDAVFPDIDRSAWREVSREDRETGSGVGISFVVLERIGK